MLYVQEMGKGIRYMNERAQSGRMEDQRFEELYARYADDVLRVSFFYLGDRQQAEDVTQDVFVRLLTHAPDLEPGKEKAWLLKVALNRCRDLWRAAWVKRVVLGSPALELTPAPDQMDDRLEKQELLAAIRKLPSDFRDVILLHYYQGYGIAEMAEMLKVPEGTISSRLSRGRKKLEEILKESGSR
ncbi:MAG: RNA polymerase sigma factor [Clostridia bacterium]|nr:RNA polymerase sigma factor [Clostridia bacterium]